MTLAAGAGAVEADATTAGSTHREASATPRVRSPVDGVRAAVGLVLVVVGLLLANVFDSTLLGLATDTADNVERLPTWSRGVAGSALASVIVAGTVALAAWSLITTRYRRFAMYSAGVAVAAGVSLALGRLVYQMVDPSVRRAFAVEVPVFRAAGVDGALNPADPLLAAATATLTIAASFLSSAVVRRASAFVAAYALATVLTIETPPLALVTDVGVGILIGSLLLLSVGRHDVALRPPEIVAALASAGFEVDRLDAASRDGGNEWVATESSGARMSVVAYSRDHRSAALAARVIRWIRLRKTGDHRPFLTLRRSVEHHALVAVQARNRGVDTPRLQTVTVAGVDGMILARDAIEGAVAAATVGSDAVLRAVWRQAAILQRTRIAHGRLNLSRFIVDDEQRVWLVGFERGELAASEQRLGTDLAELLASTAAVVGTAEAVRLAVDEVGLDTMRRAVPWLQSLALTARTRRDVGGDEGIERLRAELGDACGLEPEEPVRLERFDAKTLFVLGTVVLSAWFLAPQLADLDSLWSQVRGASWGWTMAAVVFSLATYAAATASLLGAIPVRLAFFRALVAQIASSFANRVTPAKVGGFALNLRYFQRKGVPTAVGATAVGLNAVAGVIMHLMLTLCALFLASGRQQASGLRLPSAGVLVLVLGALAMTLLVVMVVAPTRRLFTTHVVPQLRSGWDALRIVVRDPVRLTMLFGGAALITLSYLGAMIASLRAFGSSASLPLVALLFLTGSAIANAAPTPGGLGAAEAALIAALSTIEETTIVVPAVFLYRLVTFWLPILPGWVALTYLQRTDSL